MRGFAPGEFVRLRGSSTEVARPVVREDQPPARTGSSRFLPTSVAGGAPRNGCHSVPRVGAISCGMSELRFSITDTYGYVWTEEISDWNAVAIHVSSLGVLPGTWSK